MYKYEGVDTGLDALKHFSQEGYLHSPALEVPPEPSPIDAAVKAVKANTKLVSLAAQSYKDTAATHLSVELMLL